MDVNPTGSYLEVAVDDAVQVQVRQAAEHVAEVPPRRRVAERRHRHDVPNQLAALDQLHDEVHFGVLGVVEHFAELDQVGVFQPLQDGDLALDRGRVAFLRVEHFQSVALPVPRVLDLIQLIFLVLKGEQGLFGSFPPT